ncbi:permease for cytosine/purine, uracil, thiamine, allantoin family protein [Mycolicibacterium hassiacum DSM 44199]|uniref:Permease for cytosine/purine, uracil, thiamine, allantoin family protein n=1 Tax=Mycolicibacterium hassiacum (strain DSM 44199 / CIP 105218 / JCM 12690 / 3849) TaxID=1122247 RepID=K5BAG3_MYCHD|nr:NCS1 family nucleobase:cation symporter-1 [Mycolicibacterium hassiacum]EKF22190.1 permease for cytosine/purine, uracil, thiamine, allantoin family protein [Mycolicibacterium hassiacum DSM 44199]MDA4087536.1 nitrate reductase [Mycolicibacterium hassiacum DSM 44199]PZN23035.1 MAG: NCS1 family nucleobase:cation symporter-1 [Mycolicibacterium hassiacum]VCT91840.1 putative allantoin permease [Mycolicibacterium hassiacum DSM 44199]
MTDVTTAGRTGLPPGAVVGAGDLVEAAGHPVGSGAIKPDYDPRLTNEDLAPLRKQTWSSYNIFAFWMSDVHSVGGYVTAGSLFALGLASWQVLAALLIGIVIVNILCNLVAKPSQATGVPYPVICRTVFGVLGANIPAVIRGLIAVAWYGIQTYLASAALDVVLLKLFPGLMPYAQVDEYGFAGLSALGWGSFLLLWVLQACVFWRGMESIRRFIDFCGPAVYVVMFLLCGYLILKAGPGAIDLNLGEVTYTGVASIPVMMGAIALVVSYFSGPMLNFGDFSRYGRTFEAVRRGNFLGLPVNFLLFSLLVVVTASLTVPVFGELITDPVETVARIDSTFAIVLGALTFTIATIGINIVANFISPAFDFSNVAPQRISWRAGGMIAAVGSVLITPWNLYNNPEVIHYTLETLGAFIGPLFGVLIAHYYLVHKQKVNVDAMFTLDENGTYYYTKGYNPAAVIATVIGAVVAVIPVLLNGTVTGMATAAQYSWFIGCGLGLASYWLLATRGRYVVPALP